MSTVYATYAQYVAATGDTDTDQDRVELTLEDMSAELRAECGIDEDDDVLTGDAAILARSLVCDAARKGLVPPSISGFDGTLDGASQASFTANGFTQSVSLANATGSAWFDSRKLARLKKLLGKSQRIGNISFAIGGIR